MVIELLLVFLGDVVGYNLRHEKKLRDENLVLEQVDQRLRRELEVAQNLNESLSRDIAELKAQVANQAPDADRLAA